ncbi:MAG: Hpt domain-containing protein [Planctomycetia bacterium]|nr:Hpt domain-containing protein [Planctomycetia bacterium]
MNSLSDPLMHCPRKVCDLEAALARMGANVRLVREMLDLFREDEPIYLSRLHDSLAAGDAAGVKHAAHSLRGMLSVFGAESAMHVAQRLEDLAGGGELSGAAELESEFGREVARFLEVTSTELAGL